MRSYLKIHPWKIIEDGFHADYNEVSESCFSLGNGRMGLRANFEERFSGHTYPGHYLSGIYYREKVPQDYWRFGYPEQITKLVNAPNWVGVDIWVDGEVFDLATCKVKGFRRVLHMKTGLLERSFTARLVSGKEIRVVAQRFISMAKNDLGLIRYSIFPMNFEGRLTLTPYIDGEVRNRDDEQDHGFWREIGKQAKKHSGYLVTETKDRAFQVCTGMKFSIYKNREKLEYNTDLLLEENYLGCKTEVRCRIGDEITLYKYASVMSSFYHPKNHLMGLCQKSVKKAYNKGFDRLFREHAAIWKAKWNEADIVIEGDTAAQQAIRFNIFHLHQTYTGEDERLNIGPKGLTGEKYAGCTYWDSEAFCLPFFLSTAPPHVARNLLVYRYNQLPMAIENAGRLGFSNGAALFPLATTHGEECHDQWEITFEAIHRNGAIAYAIHHYVRYTGDREFLSSHGLEILIAVARFWTQRVHWSTPKQAYVIHGVTGPNEYENNTNNNWYTNYIASWCLKYACQVMEEVAAAEPESFGKLAEKTGLNQEEETSRWLKIADGMWFPVDTGLGIFLQQEDYLDKEDMTIADLKESDRPLDQNWTWDRILRSVFIKKADVLLGLFLFEDHFDLDTICRNFEYYEWRTVHESSLSPCIHSILAGRLGKYEQAYQFYIQTARLDLDNYNGNTDQGLHIPSMAGTWMAIVKGFGGLRIENGLLTLNPHLPQSWLEYSFRLTWRGYPLKVIVNQEGTRIENFANKSLFARLQGKVVEIHPS